MTIAKSIDDAMSLLKGTQASFDLADELTLEASQYLDVQKAEDSEDLTSFVKADEFMLALAKNQDENTLILSQALQDNMSASLTILKAIQLISDNLEMVNARVEQIEKTPLPRKGIVSKGEAQNLRKSVADSPADDDQVNQMIQREAIVHTLVDGVRAGRCESIDVVKAESCFGGAKAMPTTDFQEVASRMSSGGKALVKGFLTDNL